MLQKAHPLKQEKASCKGISFNSSSVKQWPKTCFSLLLWLYLPWALHVRMDHISAGFLLLMHFKEDLLIVFMPSATCSRTLFGLPHCVEHRFSVLFHLSHLELKLLKDVFLLLLRSFILLVSLLSFFGISDRCHAIAVRFYYNFEELHTTCKYFTLLAASPHFISFFSSLYEHLLQKIKCCHNHPCHYCPQSNTESKHIMITVTP